MKIDYNILWVEDNKSWYDTTLELFREPLEEKGFELKSERKINFQQVEDLIQKDGLQKYDMLLIDFTLPNSLDGDKIIELIRNNDIYTDVLFYSSAVENVRDSIRKHGLEGVYTADREEIENKFNSVFSTTIKKFQHIVAMRGMIMQEVSSLDVQMLEIVSNYLQNNKDKKQLVIDRVFKDLIEFHERKLEESKKIKDKNNFDKIIKDPLLFSSAQRASAVEEIINLFNIDNFIVDFRKEIIKVRNDFAHAILTKDEKTGREYFKDKNGGVDFNEEKCIEIRKNISKHKNNLNKLGTLCSNMP